MKIALPSRSRRPASLVPMIDVVMNLLFFFMLATTFAALAPQALAVALAGGAAASPSTVTPVLRVAPGGLTLDGKALDWVTLLARLKTQPAPSVVVEPAPNLAAAPLLDALLRLREAGVSARLTRATPGS